MRGKGRRYLIKASVTGFTNAEEEAVGLGTRDRAFLVGRSAKGNRWHPQQNANWVSLSRGRREAGQESGIFGTRSGRIAGCFALFELMNSEKG